MKKLFLRDGKLWYNEFPEVPTNAMSALAVLNECEAAVSAAKASAVEVVNPVCGAQYAFMAEGDLHDLPKGWTVEIEDQFKQNDNWFNFKDNPVSLIDAQQLADEGRTRKIARLVKIEKEGVLLQEPQYVDFNKPNIFIDGDFNDSYEARVRRSTGKGKSKIPLKEQSSGIAAVGVAEYGELEWMDCKIRQKEAECLALLDLAKREAGIPESGEKLVEPDICVAASNTILFLSRIIHGFAAGRRHDLISNDLKDCQFHFKNLLERMGAVSTPPQAESGGPNMSDLRDALLLIQGQIDQSNHPNLKQAWNLISDFITANERG